MPSTKSELTGQLTNIQLRRSDRKRTLVMCTPSLYVKKRKNLRPGEPSSSSTNPFKSPLSSLDQLPWPVLANLLRFLQVESLENLGATCYFFDQLINGRFLTSLDFPFHSSFLKELRETDTIEKKPLLKIRCKKVRKTTQGEDSPHLPLLTLWTTRSLTLYMMQSQMSLLSLSCLRELDLVPESFRSTFGDGKLDSFDVEGYMKFDEMLIVELQRQGHLNNLTRLSLMQDHHMFLQHYIASLPNLLELSITILTRTNLKYVDSLKYFHGLTCIVSKCEANILNLVVVAETRKKLNKLIFSKKVEKLTVTAPCSFNFFPVMCNLRELDVNFQDPHVCSFWKSPIQDRNLHRGGKCCVSVVSSYASCPKLEKFASLYVSERSLSPSKWFQDMTIKFYQGYLNEGGTMDLKKWQKKRWFKEHDLISRIIPNM